MRTRTGTSGSETSKEGASEAEQHARVTVRDSGCGIAPDAQAHLFDRFHQVDGTRAEVQPGTGVGLSLAKNLAELHGGTITVESEIGRGAAFTVHLPMEPTHERPAAGRTTTLLLDGDGHAPGDGTGWSGEAEITVPSSSSSSDASVTNGEVAPAAEDRPVLLIADDNAEIRTYVRSHFEDFYQVIEAADGKTALDLAREALPDLVISDVMMPRLGGFGLVEALRSDPATDFLPIILLTARAAEEDKIEGLSEGADAYLTKPFSMGELWVRADGLLASRRRLKKRSPR